MTEFKTGQAASINPNAYDKAESGAFTGEFAGSFKVVGSRYINNIIPGSAYEPRIAVQFTLLSANGKEFTKSYSTGLIVDKYAVISPDGKRLIGKSDEFKGIGPSSDAMYMLQKAITAGFPENKLTDDISVFEGSAFFFTTDVNPRAKGSSKKPYPKKYYAEGWEAYLAQRAAKAASAPSAGNPAVLQNQYQVPPVAVSPDVLLAASVTLGKILAGNSGKPVTKNELPAKMGAFADPTWETSFRQKVTIALWDTESLKAVVATNPSLKIDGETISLV